MREEKIYDAKTLLAILKRNANWQIGLNFFSSPDDYLQVGTWKYNQGQKMLPHAHKIEPRIVKRTQEVIFVKEGRIRADIYTENRELLTSIELYRNDLLILLAGGHGFEVLEDGTQVLEVKNGPYVGAERDRERI